MAMRYRRTSSMTSLPQVPQYEDFEPISEWKEEPASHALTIYLPGFSKEQMRVTVAENLRGIRVRGERPIAGNRIRRFAQEFDLPDNSKLNEMVGKFEDDKLVITIPKEVVDHRTVVDTTRAPSPPPYLKEDTTRKPSIFDSISEPHSPKHPKTTPYDREKKDETSYDSKQRDDHLRTLDQEKRETPYYASKTTSARELEKLMEEEKMKDRERKQLQEQQEEKIKEPKSVVPSRVADREMKSAEYGYSYGDPHRGLGAMPKKKDSMDAKRKEIFNLVGDTKNTLQRMAGELDEETQLTVNLALAALEVVGAVGAYISYRASSSNMRSNM